MSDFIKNESKNWQKEIREKLTDLQECLSVSNSLFNEWELSFIECICTKLKNQTISITPKQYEKIWDLWDKI